MNNQHPNSTEENSPSKPGRREFLTASAGLIAAPLLAGVAPHAQTGATAARAQAAGSTGTAYYRQDGEPIPPPGIIPIGKIDAGAEVFDVPGSVKVTIELAK